MLQKQMGGFAVHGDPGTIVHANSTEQHNQNESRTLLTDFPSWDVLPPENFAISDFESHSTCRSRSV